VRRWSVKCTEDEGVAIDAVVKSSRPLDTVGTLARGMFKGCSPQHLHCQWRLACTEESPPIASRADLESCFSGTTARRSGSNRQLCALVPPCTLPCCCLQ
jgi:hypothetical protein